MTFQEKFDSVRVLLNEHNTAVGGVGKNGYVEIDEFFETLKAVGATTEERLKQLSYEDILDCIPAKDNKIKPKILAKEIAKIFRGKEETKETQKFVSSKKAEQMTIQQLIEVFDPENYDNSVGKVIANIAKGQPFVVFSSGRIVDVPTTVKILTEIKAGYSGRTDITVDGIVKPVYKIGDLPDSFVDENPLYPYRPLRPDGTCDQTGRSWDGISLEVRQLVRLVIENEVKLTIDSAHQLMDMAVGVEAMKVLRNRYRKSSVKFDELNSTGSLPKLKVSLKKNKSPFENGQKVKITSGYGHEIQMNDFQVSK